MTNTEDYYKEKYYSLKEKYNALVSNKLLDKHEMQGYLEAHEQVMNSLFDTLDDIEYALIERESRILEREDELLLQFHQESLSRKEYKRILESVYQDSSEILKELWSIRERIKFNE